MRSSWSVVGLLLVVIVASFHVGNVCARERGKVRRVMEEVVRDNSGRIIGYIDANLTETVVRDAGRRIVGYCDRWGTYDASRRRILNSQSPGYLLPSR